LPIVEGGFVCWINIFIKIFNLRLFEIIYGIMKIAIIIVLDTYPY